MERDQLAAQYKIAVIGLGYVGLPLAVAFGKYYDVTGFDINEQRVHELQSGIDRTREMDGDEILSAGRLRFSSDPEVLKNSNVYIVTVPTPVTSFKIPDLKPLLAASAMLGKVLKPGDIVIYESTVYPGCTEDDCVPVLEKTSGLVYQKDFFCGYSPERINPGDKSRSVTTIRKITSGSTPEIAEIVDQLYGSIITAGTYKAASLKVAEAAKAIENAQRDLNISFMNELALIFDRLNIDTHDVIEAASTKWNFLAFKPGLVGGHCIGVDPHYLAHKAMTTGYQPKVILSGREINERMGIFVAEKLVALLAAKKAGNIRGNRVLILGIAFKENCADTRNTKVVDIYHTLRQAGLEVDIYDPWAEKAAVEHEYGINLTDEPADQYDAVIVAVGHALFRDLPFGAYKTKGAIIFDTQNFVDRQLVDARL